MRFRGAQVPDERLGVIVLANTPEVEPNGMAHDIAGWSLGIEPVVEETIPAEQSSAPDIDTLVGSYRDRSDRVVTVRRWFDRLRLWESSGTFVEFTWNEKAEAFADEKDRLLVFDGKRCRLRSGDEVWKGRRVKAPERDTLREFEGIYRSPSSARPTAYRPPESDSLPARSAQRSSK